MDDMKPVQLTGIQRVRMNPTDPGASDLKKSVERSVAQNVGLELVNYLIANPYVVIDANLIVSGWSIEFEGDAMERHEYRLSVILLPHLPEDERSLSV